MDEALLTTEEAAALLGMGASTLRAWRAEGLGPRFYRVGPRLKRYRRADVLAWLESRGGPEAPPEGPA